MLLYHADTDNVCFTEGLDFTVRVRYSTMRSVYSQLTAEAQRLGISLPPMPPNTDFFRWKSDSVPVVEERQAAFDAIVRTLTQHKRLAQSQLVKELWQQNSVLDI